MDSMEQRLDASYASLSTQILQSRRESHDELLAMRADVAGEFSAMRTDVAGKLSVTQTRLETAIAASQDETRRYMRVLYEDILSRIALIGERRSSSS